ncbi:uncharacterized protein LOC122871396 isoform X4 [Xyrichtys novacula]|uniref:Uncharacterized protein LOC122871396 isoform X4 n=2 Tax=Xyrichtys novacula TaxID=13765 RepID=A0AAV1F0F4_XYRNO|nr:uncharacterized protein LOC122871396 isoform X4 [Xyrichtys novacula]
MIVKHHKRGPVFNPDPPTSLYLQADDLVGRGTWVTAFTSSMTKHKRCFLPAAVVTFTCQSDFLGCGGRLQFNRLPLTEKMSLLCVCTTVTPAVTLDTSRGRHFPAGFYLIQPFFHHRLLQRTSSLSPPTAPPIKAITSPNPPHPSLPWRRLRRAGDALTESRWFPAEGPVYMSFVSKAILWDRGLCNYTAHDHQHHSPLFCPRFLSHMKSRPEDLNPPRFLSSRTRPQPPSQGRMQFTHSLPALKTLTLEGDFTLSMDRRSNSTQNRVSGRRSTVVVPCPPLPALPPSSTNYPTYLPHPNTPRHDTSSPGIVPSSPASSNPSPPGEEKDEPKEREKPPQPALASITELDLTLEFEAAGSVRSSPPASLASHGSLSDFSRPSSSLFSRSTNLASGRSSVLSDVIDSEPGGSVGLSPLHPHSASSLPVRSNPHQSAMSTTATPPLCEPLPGLQRSPSPPSTFLVDPETFSRCESAKTTENQHQAASTDPAFDSDLGPVTLAFPSATWSSCPSPPKTTPLRSDSGPKLAPSASLTQLESHRWPVLPPISPVRGRCGTAASRYSELSCSQSRVFDELEAIAPRSTSCLSLDQPDDSSCCPSPDTELSPGLAALTVGCDSGNLGSISRVQLLLLNRPEPETAPSPFSPEDEDLLAEEDWSDLRMLDDPELTSAGVSRPLTAGSVSERCDSAGEVQENKSDLSEGGSGSPSSWIIDPSPTYDVFRTADSPCSRVGEQGPTEGDSDHPGWRNQVKTPAGGSRPGSVEEKERRMEERKTKALNMLSKLQDKTPHQAKSRGGRSNFEDFDFLAKFCIFSQEKLAEYKRAFEAEDGDGDGYISCLQVLLALKTILPAELLSEEEEIYVYRILEMVDFRVTDGLVDLRLFAVIASLAQKIATMDEFMRSLISVMDFRSLEQLFLFLLEEQRGDSGAQPGFISAEQLLLELKAGGIQLEQEAAVRLELQHIPPLDLLDFLAYLPLFMLIHKSVISNPLDSYSNL